jgi:hypothetical protein
MLWRPDRLAPPLLSSSVMQHPNAATKEGTMAKVNICKLCWTAMALGAVLFWTHSAFLAFAH